MRKILLFHPLILSLLGLAFANAAQAQRVDNLRPTVFAIRDAKVVTEPGKVLPRATVVIRIHRDRRPVTAGACLEAGIVNDPALGFELLQVGPTVC